MQVVSLFPVPCIMGNFIVCNLVHHPSVSEPQCAVAGPRLCWRGLFASSYAHVHNTSSAALSLATRPERGLPAGPQTPRALSRRCPPSLVSWLGHLVVVAEPHCLPPPSCCLESGSTVMFRAFSVFNFGGFCYCAFRFTKLFLYTN